MERDLFVRLLGVVIEQKIDIEKVPSYPLTPIPLSLCHVDGGICTTDKSVLMSVVEKLHKDIHTNREENVDICIIDGFMLLHLI